MSDNKNFISLFEDGTIGIEDSILAKDAPASYGSKMLHNFVPLFDGEAVNRLRNKNYLPKGKINVGEFGLDFLGETSYYGGVTDDNGNLSSAAALVLKENSVEAVLGTDVNGAPRRGAALGGYVCLKPTYGTVSRYGVIPGACSGEQITVSALNVEKVMEITGVIAGHDAKDGTSHKPESYTYDVNKSLSGMKFALIKELTDCCDPEMKTAIQAQCDSLKAQGALVEEVSFPLAGCLNSTWMTLSSAEICNNLSRYDGVKYGHRSENYKDIGELYKNSRSEAFGLLTKFIILYGSDMLSKERYDDCYDKAMRVRRMIQEQLLAVLKEYDCVVTPVTSKCAYPLTDAEDSFKLVCEESKFTALGNLTGCPALVAGPVQFIGNLFDENTLFSAAKGLERTVAK